MTIRETRWVLSLASWCVARMDTSLAGDSLTIVNYGLMSSYPHIVHNVRFARTGRGGHDISRPQNQK